MLERAPMAAAEWESRQVTPGELMAAIARLATREPTIVAFDGLAGSGKTTVANAARRASGGRAVTIVAADDFYQPDERNWRCWTPRQGYERYFDHVRLESELLRPLRQRRTARFSTFDWQHRAPGPCRSVEPRDIVVVEGVFLLKPRLRPYWDASVWVQTPRDVRERRLKARGEGDRDWIERWMRAEDYYLEVDHPAEAATFVVLGE